MKKFFYAIAISAVTLFASPAFANTEAVEELNGLLEGELSAIETYRQAMKTVPAADLKVALSNHEKAATDLSSQIRSLGGTPVKSSGLWGTWTQAVTGTAKAIGNETALKALREGEQHGVDEYQEALNDEDVPAVAKNLIKEKLIPNQKEHIATLDKLIGNS